MPYIHDFSDIKGIRKTIINPKGWVQPLVVEYGISLYGSTPAYFWRVSGTQHTFVIPLVRMNFISAGKYEEHFTQVLEKFREDYIEWANDGYSEKWMQEYRDMYKRYITV